MFRPMRRSRQELSAEECGRILREEKRGVLALAGDDGYPYAVPMNYVYTGEAIYFHSAPEGHRVDALSRCDKVSFCVIDRGEKPADDWAYYFNSVIVFGRMRAVEGEEKEKGLRLLGMKYFPSAAQVEEDMQKHATHCLCLRMEIDHMSGKHVHER